MGIPDFSLWSTARVRERIEIMSQKGSLLRALPLTGSLKRWSYGPKDPGV
jgi:hypothetical protein